MSDTVLSSLSWIIPTAILLVGVIEDVRTKKVRNNTVVLCAGVALLSAFLVGGWQGLSSGILSGGVGLIVSLPLVLLGILGAGDMKLFVAFGFATQWQTVTGVFVSALVWGAILGVLQSILKGDAKALFQNIRAVLLRIKVEKTALHTVPYTIALLFGWLSMLTIEKYGGKIL